MEKILKPQRVRKEILGFLFFILSAMSVNPPMGAAAFEKESLLAQTIESIDKASLASASLRSENLDSSNISKQPFYTKNTTRVSPLKRLRQERVYKLRREESPMKRQKTEILTQEIPIHFKLGRDYALSPIPGLVATRVSPLKRLRQEQENSMSRVVSPVKRLRKEDRQLTDQEFLCTQVSSSDQKHKQNEQCILDTAIIEDSLEEQILTLEKTFKNMRVDEQTSHIKTPACLATTIRKEQKVKEYTPDLVCQDKKSVEIAKRLILLSRLNNNTISTCCSLPLSTLELMRKQSKVSKKNFQLSKEQSSSDIQDTKALHEELDLLRKELAIAKEERDVLKKATAYFAREVM